ncbi:SH3 domain-containing protein [Chitinophaga agrisoli]|uniref:SH3 domain-containing protein n=1 Tax=Chitinophaga agrisoli TaxID=2607653 RepID=A0A5B2VIN5_9BACT|nr:SH3 domain-containing protein [Chitinophaga agrisoli]KAA2238406.1 SH3 domain-containing protein [Chitinophaga agrisoli]
MKQLLLFLFTLAVNIVHAQEQPNFPDMRSWMIYAGDTTERYIFADTAFVRASPGIKGAPADTLFAGDNVRITAITAKPLTIRGINGPWLKIDYSKNGEQKNGYIWQGLLSCAPLRRGDTKFIYGIERRADSLHLEGTNTDTIRRFMVGLKVVQQGGILARASFITPDDESANSSFGKVMSGMGLSNVQNVVVLSFSGEACGIPTYDYYFAWTNPGHLLPLPGKVNIADAGVFYQSETFTFPNEKNGKPDMILWNMTTEEATDKVDKNGENIMKTTEKKSAAYTWDGVNGKIAKSGQR